MMSTTVRRRPRGALVAVLSAVALALALALVLVAAEIDPNDKGEPLFPEGHPNITYFTDENWDEIMATQNDRPWLVDFYHPFCPHCKHFVPAFTEIAAYYKVEGSIYIGALSCMDHVKCRRVSIKGFPTLIAINFDKKRPGQEVTRVVGTHTVQEVKDFVNKLLLEAKVNETGTQPPGASAAAATTLPVSTAVASTSEAPKPGEQERKELWEESTKPMNQTTRLQDAGSAFIFGLKQGVFMGREYLEDLELDALKNWLLLVSKTFPGTINRLLVRKLYEKVEPIALLDFDLWEKIVDDWQKATVTDFHAEEAKLDFAGLEILEWQRLPDLFVGHGVTYRACALYTCGQWNMFHMLTMNPVGPGVVRDDQLLVSVVATMRRFIKHFFGCVQCRDHFLEYNTLEMVKKIASAENKPRALKRWLWEMHNAVNKRIRHPLWPKPDVCPTCGEENNWLDVEVDKWLGNTYEYHEVTVPVKTEAPVVTTTSPPDVDPQMPAAHDVLRKEQDGHAPPEATENSEVWKPKDADLGIDNPAQNAHQSATPQAVAVENQANMGQDQQSAPPVSLFAWYILPVAAVGAYFMFVRSRKRSTFRH